MHLPNSHNRLAAKNFRAAMTCGEFASAITGSSTLSTTQRTSSRFESFATARTREGRSLRLSSRCTSRQQSQTAKALRRRRPAVRRRDTLSLPRRAPFRTVSTTAATRPCEQNSTGKTRLTQWGNCVDDDGWRWSFKWIVRGSSIDSAFLNFRLRIPLRLFLRRERLGWYFLKTEIGLYWNRAF